VIVLIIFTKDLFGAISTCGAARQDPEHEYRLNNNKKNVLFIFVIYIKYKLALYFWEEIYFMFLKYFFLGLFSTILLLSCTQQNPKTKISDPCIFSITTQSGHIILFEKIPTKWIKIVEKK